MKNTFYLTILLLLSISCKDSNNTTAPEETNDFNELWSGWEIKKIVSDSIITANDIFFLNDKTGYTAGAKGLYKTSNSGQSWRKLNTNTPLALTSVFFLNEIVGYAGGRASAYCVHEDCDRGSLFMKTTDGGENWSKIFFHDYTYIGSLQFLNESTGLAIGYPTAGTPQLIRTTDGGTTWEVTTQNISTLDVKRRIFAVDNIVYLLGHDPAILKSEDFGKTWAPTNLPAAANIKGLQFLDQSTGYAYSNNSLYKTTDGGANWTKSDFPYASFSSFVHFTNEQEAFGVGLEATNGFYGYQTTTSGLTWNKSSTYYKTFAVDRWHFPNANLGYAVYVNDFYTFKRK
jgi:photosystem II stability/assembly factor-like uncharacterized protein